MGYADPKSEAAKANRRACSRRYYYRNRADAIARSTKWKRENAIRVNEEANRRRSCVTSIKLVLWRNARNRAKVRGMIFNITVDDIVVPETCPVLGIPLVVGTGFAKENSPSIDRKESSRGYEVGNIAVISHKANTMKSNASLSDLRKLVAYLEAEDVIQEESSTEGNGIDGFEGF